MKRRILSLILAFVFIVALLPIGTMNTLAAPAAEQVKSSETVFYPVPGGSILFDPATGTVTGYEGEPTEIDIPDKINDVPVVAIGESAFSTNSLSRITIPNGVTTIGKYAFAFCSALKRVDIPGSVTTIGDSAFEGSELPEGIWVNENNPNYCSDKNGILFSKDKTVLVAYPCAFSGSYTIPDGVTTIGDYAFARCSNLTAITFPNSLKTIGNGAFDSCDSLSSLNIPNGVTTIGTDAFFWCWGLECVEIPASVTTIDPGAFSYCLLLEGIWVDENNPNYCSDKKGVLFNKDKTELVAYPGALSDSYTIPNGVTTIGDYAFAYCNNLPGITFPDSVTSIGDYAFYNCFNLTDITLPNSLKTIGSSAFSWCDSLTHITIPNGVTTIGDDAFSLCWSLERVEIPASVTTIDSGAFSNCIWLKGIWVDENNPNYSSDKKGVLFNKNKTELISCPGALADSYIIPDGVTTIDDHAFINCNDLTSVTIPDSVTTIGDEAFANCQNLTAIALPDSVTTIGNETFAYCENLTAIALPDSITTIGDEAFTCCYNLTAIALPDSLTSIGVGTFSCCESLTTIALPDSVTTIGDYAFYGCCNLTAIALPDSVTFLGDEVFWDCLHLTNIYYGGTQAQWAQLSNEYNDFSGISIHYNETRPWHPCPGNDFADIPFFNNWAHDGIDYCVENELMNGVGGNLFNPNGTVSRAQLVTILYRVAGSPETEFKGAFTDVAEGLWYSDAIEWAAANGVVNGIGDGKFAPDQNITREQIATILYRYSGSPAVKGNLNAFPDKGSVSGFAVDGLIWATQVGLINGVSSNNVITLAPKSNATRAQIAAIIMRYREGTWETWETGLIGISMPTRDLWRWMQDGTNMQSQLEAAGYEVDLQFAANDVAMQISQIENMIANGAKVLVITPIDGEALGTVLAQAKEAGVTVISYDRLIMGSDAVTYYTTFDNFLVGVMQGQYIVDVLDLDNATYSDIYNIEYVTGDPGDSNINFFFDGAMSVLQPYIDSGVLVCQSGQTEKYDVTTENWDAFNAQKRFEHILSTYYADKPLHAVLASNDSTAQGVATALFTTYSNEIYPVITGMDCDIVSVQNMLDGKQAMSVFKDTRDLAAKTLEMVDAIMQGRKPPINDVETYDNGTGIIPSYLCAPKVCNINNYKELLIDSGYYDEEWFLY